jgi:hypothetical protein
LTRAAKRRAFVGSVALVACAPFLVFVAFATACGETRRALGEDCLREDDCLSGFCVSRTCVAAPPTGTPPAEESPDASSGTDSGAAVADASTSKEAGTD